MQTTFEKLVHGIFHEIERRDPVYLQKFAIPMAALPHLLEQFPVPAELDAEQVSASYQQGLQLLQQAGMSFTDNGENDPLGLTIATALLDAVYTSLGILDLQAEAADPRPLAAVLQSDYAHTTLPDGRSCYIANHGNIPLLIVNALGFAIDFWRPLLLDTRSEFKPVIIESKFGGLFTGGMKTPAGLNIHADDLAQALEFLNLPSVVVLGWCNGGRISLDFAARYPQRVNKILLLSPTFRGTNGTEQAAPSSFEENMQYILQNISKNPKLAPVVSKMIKQLFKPPVWDSFENDAARANTLLALADSASSELMMTALASTSDVLNTVTRNAIDENYPIHETMATIKIPIHVIQGDCDSIVSNAQTNIALSYAHRPVVAILRGAGHYIHQLQYPYLKHLIDLFLLSDQPKESLHSSATRIIS